MRKFIVVPTIGAVTVAALVVASEAGAQGQKISQAEREVRQTLEDYTAAYGANNLDKYFSYFADDMTTWWNNLGRRDEPTPKKRYMELYPETVKKTGGYTGCKLEDLRIKVGASGDAAVGSYKQICGRKNPTPGREAITYWMGGRHHRRPAAGVHVHTPAGRLLSREFVSAVARANPVRGAHGHPVHAHTLGMACHRESLTSWASRSCWARLPCGTCACSEWRKPSRLPPFIVSFRSRFSG